MPSKNVKDFLTVNSLNLSTASILTIVGGELKRFTGQTIVIDSNGNVAIGATSVTSGYKLDTRGWIRAQHPAGDCVIAAVAGNTTGVSALYFGDSASDTVGSIEYNHTSNSVYVTTNAAERLRIDSDGNVGIGTAGIGGPAAKLHLYGSGTTSRFYTNGDVDAQTLYLQDNLGAAGNGGQILFGASQGAFAGIKGHVDNGTGPAGTLIFQTRSTSGNVLERMSIDSIGNVGIGITTPLVKTHIRYARSGGVASDTIAGLFLDAYHGEVTAPTVGSSIYLRSSRSATLGTQAVSVNGDDSRIRFYFSDGTNFVPAAAVNGSVDGAPAAGSVAGKLLFLTTSAAATAPSTKMTIDKAGIVTITNLGTGTVSSTAGVLSAASDARMKISDGEIENAINKIQNLKPKYFYWKDENNNKDESKGRQLGFFAQEVNEQVPEAAPGLNDQWGIYDRSLIAVLVKAVQELKVEIDILKNK